MPNAPICVDDLGAIASDITAAGTNIEDIAAFRVPSVNESIDAQSTPKSAATSPARTELTSSISFECIRTSRGTLTALSKDWLSSDKRW